MSKNSTVIYKDIPGFPGYKAGTDGSIWSFRPHRGTNKRKLTPKPKPSGHQNVILYGTKTRMIHSLILETFVGPRPEGMEACHFPDRDPSNNALSNLRWDTPKSNQADKVKHGTDNRGEKHGQAKHTEKKVRAIRADYDAGWDDTFTALGLKHGVHRSAARQIALRISWKHVV